MSVKYVITFHRTYEIPEEIVLKRIDEVYGEDMEELISEQDEKELKQEVAEEIARDYLGDELPFFVDNTKDSFSATIDIKNDSNE